MTLDNPPYRQQRIVLPVLGWLLSWGNPELAAVALIFVNFVGLSYLAWAGAQLMRRFGRAPAWGLLLPLYPAIEIALVRDLTEIVSTCSLATAILALLDRRWRLAAVCLCGAVLARETTVLFAIALLVAALLPRLRRFDAGAAPGHARVPRWVPALPLAVFAVWQAYLWSRWGVLPLAAGRDNFAVPLSGVLGFVTLVGRLPDLPVAWFNLFDLINVALVGVACAICLRSTHAGLPVRLAWLGYGALALLLSSAVWQSDWHVYRALVEWHLLGLLILAGSRYRWALVPLLSICPVMLATTLLALAD